MRIRLLSALALLLLTTGCSMSRGASMAPPPPAEATAVPSDASARVAGAERLLVRRAELVVEAERPEALEPRVQEIIRAAEGYVESSVVSEGRLRASLRVPSAAMESTLASLSALGEVERRQVSALDVTEQVIDLEARLQNQRAVRDRLRQHLDRAAAVSDVIQVERELARVQAEIEMLEGRLERLRTETALSQINLEIRQKRILGPLGQLFAGLAWVIEKLFVIR